MDLSNRRAVLLPLLAALSACASGPPASLPPPPGPTPMATSPLLAVSGACVARDEPDAGEREEPYGFGRAALDAPEDPADLCAVADSNLERAASAVLAAARPPPAPAPARLARAP